MDSKTYPVMDRKSKEISFFDGTNVVEATYYKNSLYGHLMCGYSHFSLTGVITATTNLAINAIQVEGTNDEDPVNANWIPVYGYDSKNNSMVNIISVTGTGVLVTVTFSWDFDFINYRYIRVKVVVGDDVNTIIIKGRFST